METRARRFINSFVRIEMALKRELGVSNERFTVLVQLSSRNNSYVKAQRVFLEEMAQLRNAIVHSRIGEDEVIAEPHERVVVRLEKIAKALDMPPLLKELKRKRVLTVQVNESLKAVAQIQNETGYSVVPVYDGQRYIGCVYAQLFNELVNHADSSLDIAGLVVGDLLRYHRKDDRIVFMSGDDTVYDVLSVYEKLYQQGKALVAIIITKTGARNEVPLSILTQRDLPQLFVALE